MTISVNNKIPNDKIKKYSLGAAAFTGISCGLSEVFKQKQMFKNADVLIKKAEAKLDIDKRYCTPLFKGTEKAANLAKKELEDNFNNFKDFLTNKKINFKQVGKAGIVFGALAGTIVLLSGLIENLRRNK